MGDLVLDVLGTSALFPARSRCPVAERQRERDKALPNEIVFCRIPDFLDLRVLQSGGIDEISPEFAYVIRRFGDASRLEVPDSVFLDLGVNALSRPTQLLPE